MTTVTLPLSPLPWQPHPHLHYHLHPTPITIMIFTTTGTTTFGSGIGSLRSPAELSVGQGLDFQWSKQDIGLLWLKNGGVGRGAEVLWPWLVYAPTTPEALSHCCLHPVRLSHALSPGKCWPFQGLISLESYSLCSQRSYHVSEDERHSWWVCSCWSANHMFQVQECPYQLCLISMAF